MTQNQAQSLLDKLQSLDHLTGKALQEAVVQLLDQEVEYYNWTGFYFMNMAFGVQGKTLKTPIIVFYIGCLTVDRACRSRFRFYTCLSPAVLVLSLTL